MDRHVIANMGAELGATSTVFPSDEQVRTFLRAEQREDDFVDILAEAEATYDVTDEIDLSTVEPLIALPSSPGNVVAVREVAGRDVEQVVLGSSANPGLRDFAVVAAIVAGRQTHPRVSFDVNLASDLAGSHEDGRDVLTHRRRGTAAPVRLHGLHRHGAGTGERTQQPAHCPRATSPDGPEPARIRSSCARPSCRGGRAHRADHRPAGPAVPARYRTPEDRVADRVQCEHRDARTAAVRAR
jgi:hypothetical protein